MLPRSFVCIPAETNRVVQVKYTNPNDRKIVHVLTRTGQSGKSMLLVQNKGSSFLPASVAAKDLWSFFFWIKSSAKRAFGECLGSKRR